MGPSVLCRHERTALGSCVMSSVAERTGILRHIRSRARPQLALDPLEGLPAIRYGWPTSKVPTVTNSDCPASLSVAISSFWSARPKPVVSRIISVVAGATTCWRWP
jgi:hypothetical protein